MIRPQTTYAAMTACALTAFALAPQASSMEEVQPTHEVVQVMKEAFEAQATMQGRYAADVLSEIHFEAERYRGELKIAEVLVSHGEVAAGQIILKLQAPDMQEQLTDAREALVKAKLRFEWAKKKSQITRDQQAIAAERRKLSLADKLSAHQRWDEFGKKDTYRKAELTMQTREDNLADEAQELKQLEELYDGAKLASRTQDIVLGRARRSLAGTQASIEIARRTHKVYIQETLPNYERDTDNSLRWIETEHANAAWRETVAMIEQSWSLDSARETFEDAQEAVAELEKDAAQLQIKAEHAGVMTMIDLQPGDKISAGRAIAKLYAPAKGTLKATLSTKDLRVVQEGSTAEVHWDWFGEVATAAKVRHIAWQGKAGGAKEAKYDVTIDVDQVAAAIRPGMTANIKVIKQFDDKTLSVPVDAVASDEQGTYCMVKVDQSFERRAVSIGANNGELIQIIKGLSADESVRIPAK